MNDLLKAADAMAEAIRKYLHGDYEGPHQHNHRHPTLKWKCEHGVPNTNACEACIDAHFEPTLSAYEAAKKEAEEINRASAAIYQQYVDLINGTKRPSHD